MAGYGCPVTTQRSRMLQTRWPGNLPGVAAGPASRLLHTGPGGPANALVWLG